jgi:hypothetical protein
MPHPPWTATAFQIEGGAAREVPVEDAVRLAESGSGPVWIDIDGCDADTARRLLEPLHIHPLALEDMVMQVNRPKVDDYGEYLYIAVHSARWEFPEKPTLREVDVLIGRNFIVTYHEGETRSVTAAMKLLPRRPELLARGPAYLLHFVLDVLVDNYLPVTDALAVQIDELEEEVLRRPGGRIQVRILRLKRGMAALRRIVGPQRDTILALTRDDPGRDPSLPARRVRPARADRRSARFVPRRDRGSARAASGAGVESRQPGDQGADGRGDHRAATHRHHQLLRNEPEDRCLPVEVRRGVRAGADGSDRARHVVVAAAQSVAVGGGTPDAGALEREPRRAG